MTAVPHTAAPWPTVLRQTVQPLRGNQREPPWPRPTSAAAAKRASMNNQRNLNISCDQDSFVLVWMSQNGTLLQGLC